MLKATDAPTPNLPPDFLVEITLSAGVSFFKVAMKRPDASMAFFDPSALTLASVVLTAFTTTSLSMVALVLSPNLASTSLMLLMPIAIAPAMP